MAVIKCYLTTDAKHNGNTMEDVLWMVFFRNIGGTKKEISSNYVQ